MKKQTLGIRTPVWTLAFCLFALVFASCGEPGDPAKASPPPPDQNDLSFDNVIISYQKDSGDAVDSGFKFSKKKSASFEAEHDKAKDGYHLNVTLQVPEKVKWTLVSGNDKESLKKSYKKLQTEAVDEENKKTGEWKDISEPIDPTESPELLGLPVPRLAPLYDVFLEADPNTNIKSSYKEIKLTFELTLKDGVDRKFIGDDGFEHEWQDSTYVLTIKEQDPGKKNFTDEEKVLINDRIAEAEKAIKAFEILVGNPKLTSEGGDNDAEALEISKIMDELVVLKEGITEYMYFETTTQPDGTRVGTETHEDGSSNYAELEAWISIKDENGTQKAGWCYYGQNEQLQIVYMVKQPYQIYDTPMILYKATELNTRLTEYIAYCTSIGRSPRLVVQKLRLEYLTAAQAGVDNQERVQPVGIASKGEYSIELVGGSGGHVWTGSDATTTGGNAARIVAKYVFDPNGSPPQKRLGFRIGGEGIGTADLATLNSLPQTATKDEKRTALQKNWTDSNKVPSTMAWTAEKDGGWNGGGKGGQTVDSKRTYEYAPGSGGGGATDVRFYDGDSKELFVGVIDFDPATDARFMVSAGGGGSAQSASGSGANRWLAFRGGNAGENGSSVDSGNHLGALQAERTSDLGKRYTPYAFDPLPPMDPSYAKTPSASGDNGIKGADKYEGRGGGGGGFKGGEAITSNTKYKNQQDCTGSGAGGSSHIRPGMAMSGSIMTLYDKYGNGYAVIEWKKGVK